MTKWVEFGNRYITAIGTITSRMFRTPPTSVYRENFPFAAYLGNDGVVDFWNEEGQHYRQGSGLDLDDCIDGRDPDELEEAIYQSDMQFFLDVKKEVVSARSKFSNTDLAHAFTEEFGEVIKSLLDQKQKNKVSSEEIYKECVQAAAMAMRLALEGDPCFPKYQPPTGQ
jgi:hypothetical protein